MCELFFSLILIDCFLFWPFKLRACIDPLQVCHVYATTLVAWLYWSHYVSSLLLSCCNCVPAVLKRTPSEEPKAGTTTPLRRLYHFSRPYLLRFTGVLSLVILSSYGKTDPPRMIYSDLLSLIKGLFSGSFIIRNPGWLFFLWSYILMDGCCDSD